MLCKEATLLRLLYSSPNIGLPWWLSWWRICLQCKRPWFDFWVRKIHSRRDRLPTPVFLGFPCGSADKESICHVGDLGLIPGLWGSPGERKGYTLQYSAAAKSLQLCPTLCDLIDGSPSGSSIPGILQARTLEWVAISFSSAWKWKVKVKSLSRVLLLATQPTRLLRPWDFPGKSTGVGCHCLLRSWEPTSLQFWLLFGIGITRKTTQFGSVIILHQISETKN